MRPGLAGRLSRALVGWHPRRWRERYAEEMVEVLSQHDPTARTVASLWASAVSAHFDPAWRTGRLSLARLRRAALVSALAAAPLLALAVPFAYGAWQDSHWHPAYDEGLLGVGFAAHSPIMVTAFGGAMSGMDVVWDVRDPGHPERLSRFEGGQPTALSPDGRTVATVAFGGEPALWNVADPRHPAELTTLPNGDGGLRGQVFSPDGQILAAAYDHQVLLWDMASPPGPHRDGQWPAVPRAVPGRAGETQRNTLRRLRPGQLRSGVRPRRAHPDRCHQPHGDERRLRARHHLQLARDQLRDARRQQHLHPRRRRLPAPHTSRRPHRDGQPGRQPRVAHLAAALTRAGPLGASAAGPAGRRRPPGSGPRRRGWRGPGRSARRRAAHPTRPGWRARPASAG